MNIKYLTFALILFSLGTNAQDKLSLDVASARRYAIEHNRMLVSSNYAIDKSQYALREAIANGLPQVNAVMDYSNALGAVMSIRFSEMLPPTEIPIKPQSNLNISVGQLVFSGNYIVGIQTAQLARDLTRLSYRKTEYEVLTQVTESYYLVLLSKQMLDILKLNQTNLDALFQKMTAMESVGMIEKTDVDQLSVQVNALKNAVSSAQRQLELATNMLRFQLGTAPETVIELTESLQDIIVKTNLESSSKQGFTPDQNIDFKILSQQELITKKMVDMKRANSLPTMTAFYRHTVKFLEPDFDMSPDNIVGFQVNIPIFSSGVRLAQVQQAKIDLKNIHNNKELVTDQLIIQEKQLRFNYNNALEAYLNQKNNVEVSRRVYNSLKLKYEQGMMSGLDLINADNNYLKAETDYITSMMQLLQAGVQLEKLYGTIK